MTGAAKRGSGCLSNTVVAPGGCSRASTACDGARVTGQPLGVIVLVPLARLRAAHMRQSEPLQPQAQTMARFQSDNMRGLPVQAVAEVVAVVRPWQCRVHRVEVELKLRRPSQFRSSCRSGRRLHSVLRTVCRTP